MLTARAGAERLMLERVERAERLLAAQRRLVLQLEARRLDARGFDLVEARALLKVMESVAEPGGCFEPMPSPPGQLGTSRPGLRSWKARLQSLEAGPPPPKCPQPTCRPARIAGSDSAWEAKTARLATT